MWRFYRLFLLISALALPGCRTAVPYEVIVVRVSEGVTVTTIIEPGVEVGSFVELSQASYDAVIAARAAWAVVRGPEHLHRVSVFQVVITSHKELNKNRTTEITAKIVKVNGIPTAVVSDEHVDKAKRTGDPIIHEVIHALRDDYLADEDDHIHKDLWAMHKDPHCVQNIARRMFKKRRD